MHHQKQCSVSSVIISDLHPQHTKTKSSNISFRHGWQQGRPTSSRGVSRSEVRGPRSEVRTGKQGHKARGLVKGWQDARGCSTSGCRVMVTITMVIVAATLLKQVNPAPEVQRLSQDISVAKEPLVCLIWQQIFS